VPGTAGGMSDYEIHRERIVEREVPARDRDVVVEREVPARGRRVVVERGGGYGYGVNWLAPIIAAAVVILLLLLILGAFT
jgi:hypothetical protein